jgi:exosortase/archaeosortase family protein
MSTHGRDLRFLAIFGLLMLIYYFVSTTEVMTNRFFPWYLKVTTDVSGAMLKATGYQDVRVEGNDLVGAKGRITVERGCDAVAPTALFVSAVIASPAVIGMKLVAVIGGVTILMVVNVIRIITLFLTAVHWSAAFDVMHLDVWQAAFIFLAIVLWALWASWAAKRARARRAREKA